MISILFTVDINLVTGIPTVKYFLQFIYADGWLSIQQYYSLILIIIFHHIQI